MYSRLLDLGYTLFKQPTWKEITADVALNNAGLATIIIADIIIASAVVYVLLSKRSDIARTQNILQRLITFAIGTGLVTT
jgi:uncharacterized membrane protein